MRGGAYTCSIADVKEKLDLSAGKPLRRGDL